MEERKLNLEAPFLSVRRMSSNHSDKQTKSFDHRRHPASVPFVWELTPGMPKNMPASELPLHKLIQITCIPPEEGYLSFNSSLMVTRFLPEAKAMALRQHKQQLQQVPLYRHTKYKEDDESFFEGDDNGKHSNGSKKGWEFLPGICSKNSLDVLNPAVLSSRVNTCQNLRKSGKIIQPTPICRSRSSPIVHRSRHITKDSGGDLSGRSSSLSESMVTVSSDKADVTRAHRSPPLHPKSAEIQNERSSIHRNPWRLQRTAADRKHQSLLRRSKSMQEAEFLPEEVKKKRNSNSNSNRSKNILEASHQSFFSVYLPPLPKSPSESWLIKTLNHNTSLAV